MKIKTNYERIIDEITLIDNRIMRIIILNHFSDEELIKIGGGPFEPTAHNIAMIIMLRPKSIDYIQYLKKVIKKNNMFYDPIFTITMSFEEIEEAVEKKIYFKDSIHEIQYFSALLLFFSNNIFQNETVNLLKKKCKNVFEDFVQIALTRGDDEKNEIIELSEKPDQFPELKGQFAGLRKYRVGNYRVIYAIIDDSVLILRIQHRKNVYKK